jgi:LuxR family maltose regulon positive regulatory protein
MRDLGEAAWRDPLGRFGWNMVAREIALSERWDEIADEAREAGLALGRDPKRRVAFEGIRAVGEALAGRPVDALRIAAGVRHAASVSSMTILRAELAIAEAVAHREVGDRQRAIAELESLAEAPAEAMLYCRILACLELAQARLDVGELDTARRAFEAAEALVAGESFGPDGRDWLYRVGTLVALAAGAIQEAHRLSNDIGDRFWGRVSVARVRLAEGDRAGALNALELVKPRCPRHEVVLGLLKARALDDHDESVKFAAIAIGQAADVGILQTVASEGREVMELVERAAWRAPAPWLSRLRRAAGAGGSHLDRRSPVEPLTEREYEVLRFLPSRLTVREIADELYISRNTLKFHLKVIYRKLGVGSRAEAAEAARRMAHAERRR